MAGAISFFPETCPGNWQLCAEWPVSPKQWTQMFSPLEFYSEYFGHPGVSIEKSTLTLFSFLLHLQQCIFIYPPSRITALSWQRVLYNSIKLWTTLYRATQNGWITVRSSDETWSTGEGNGNPLQYTCLENPMNSKKRQNDMAPEDEPPRLDNVQYATGEEQRNSSRMNEEARPKQKWHSVVDMSGGESKAWWY